MKRSIKTIFLGKALTNDQLGEEKLSVLWGLPIMSSDAVSSVAYAVEEILLALVPGIGLLSVNYVGMVSVPIILLLLMLVFSYSQIINHYPNGGGSYVVSKENFGKTFSLIAAACLIIDYIMTVAVSTSSSTAAIIAAFPFLDQHRVMISLISIAIITLINLRGVTESSKIFGIPTYGFIFSMGILIITGFIKILTGSMHPISYSESEISAIASQQALQGITLLLFLRAFSSGCSALTGVEAVSNAIPNFKEPSQKTAKHVLYLLGIIIVFIFGGTSFLASFLKVLPAHDTTVMSQMATAVFGNGIMYYLVQFTTSLILLLAANTAYNGLPILLSILAKDRFMPRQFAHRGTKLSFSNGILFIFIVAGILLIAFKADTHKLIPFYSVGVFVSFTISQAGMFVKWLKIKENGWQYKSLINGFGSIVTFIGTIVVFVTKFTHGAWMLVVAIPLIMLFMSYTNKHYRLFTKSISAEEYNYKFQPSTSNDVLPCIVLIHNMSKATLKTLDYAKQISSNVIALHVSTTQANTNILLNSWKEMNIGIELEVINAPYRDILTPLEAYITPIEKTLEKHENLTVVLTKFVSNNLTDNIFHNQTTFFIASKLSKHKNIVTALVPYIYRID